MTPDVWGRFLWYSIHFIALDYPSDPTPDQAAAYRAFFETLGRVLPCYKCSKNYERHLKEMPLTPQDLLSKDALFAWTVALHNIVNKETGKSEMSVAEARNMYLDPDFKVKVGCSKPMLSSSTAPTILDEQKTSDDIPRYIIMCFVGILVGVMFTWLLTKKKIIR